MKIERIESFILHPGTGKNCCSVAWKPTMGCMAGARHSKCRRAGLICPRCPGLGIIDAEQLRKRPYQQFPNRRMRHYWEEFPRHQDYVNRRGTH